MSEDQARRLLQLLDARAMTLCLAESCTGGLIGGLVTGIPGASARFLGGVVAYADSAKAALLGVDPALIVRFGAVSAETVAAMAAGARRAFGADVALAVSGIAGPGGGSPEKPVGTVYLGLDVSGKVTVRKHLFSGDRARIRMACAVAALEVAADALAG